ncbi:MAG TPA: hypothetical protein DCS28_01155 [Candidatus Moranbacteria bacterium]|nr:hypothetical protein [Candidatus Moranbacteria bacterium]HAT74637.1 hypothetical protein [Candidatus Moranbacteria bacterium]
MKKKMIRKESDKGVVTKDYLDKKIDQVMLAVAKGFEANDKRFDRLEGRMDRLEGRMDRLEVRMDGIEEKIVNLDGRVGGLEKKVEYLSSEFIGMKQELKDLGGYASRSEDSMNNLMNTLDRLLKKQDDAQDEFTIIKARMDKVEKFIFKKFGFEISAV